MREVTSRLSRISLLARVVSRADVVDTSRPEKMNFDDTLFACRPDVMRMICWPRVEGARFEQVTFLFDLFANTKADATADHGDGLGIRGWGGT